MKNWRVYYAAILGSVALAALFGFVITYGSSSQGAFARLFVDVGAFIAIAAFIGALPRPQPLRTDVVVDALRDLARGRYHTRIVDDDLGDLNEVAQAFNELAGSLSDRINPTLAGIRQRPQPVVPRPQPATEEEEHSYHPELGPVKAAPIPEVPLPPPPPPPAAPPAPIAQVEKPLLTIIPPVSTKPEEHLGGAPEGLMEVAPPAAVAVEVEEALFDLYDAFAKALHAHGQEMISYDTFKETIDKTKSHLMDSHHCRDVKFEIVVENQEVALRPRLIR